MGEASPAGAALPFTPGPSAFGRLLICWNGLDAAGFAAWDFAPGMRFGERAAWWREGAPRTAPHEGLDLCRYRTADGRLAPLRAGARIPAVWPGRVVAVVDDFLGASVFVEHDRFDRDGRRLHSVLGHLRPEPGLAPGDALGEEAQVGAVADGSGGTAAVPPHLHLTIALIAREGGPPRLDWEAMQDGARVLLIDPLPVVADAAGRNGKGATP